MRACECVCPCAVFTANCCELCASMGMGGTHLDEEGPVQVRDAHGVVGAIVVAIVAHVRARAHSHCGDGSKIVTVIVFNVVC